MAENVKVIVRCRPMNRKEIDMKCKNIVKIEDCVVNLENPNDNQMPPKVFTYDNAYGYDAPTEAIYSDICYSLVENVIEGYNGTIFAYGQTGCGKSHTMQGPESNDVLGHQRGIISRAFDHIFESISVNNDVRYLIVCSYLEIYNENIRDLLNPSTSTTSSSSMLQLKENSNGTGIYVQNLSAHTVHTSADCEKLFEIGSKNRMVGATLMNSTSSRSHSIFTINLEQIDIKSANNATTSKTTKTGIRKGKLNLIDLAGSERQTKTGAKGDRLKEATKINLSLSALGNVISALVDGKLRHHIPYRDSKLTRLLQDSLGGNTKTLMIACISPAAYNYDETLSTLRYANRAKMISNKPKINEDPKDTMLREYQNEIQKLREMLQQNNSSNNHGSSNDDNDDNDAAAAAELKYKFEMEQNQLKRIYDKEMEQLKYEHDAQQKEKEDLVKDMEKLKIMYEQEMNMLKNQQEQVNMKQHTSKSNEIIEQKIKELKNDLIGGEHANDIQLREKHKKKKIAAEKRLSALANALSRVEQSEDRDILQEHYTDIEQELQAKTDALKKQRQKVRAYEREITDLQSEFQLDRADYLDTIRKLEKNLKFYQQIIEKAIPFLRSKGLYWDIDTIKSDSIWNEDLNKWKLSESLLERLKLPPAVNPLFQRKSITRNGNLSLVTAPGRLESDDGTSSDTLTNKFNNKPNDSNKIPFLIMSPRNKSMALIDNTNTISTLTEEKRLKNNDIILPTSAPAGKMLHNQNAEQNCTSTMTNTSSKSNSLNSSRLNTPITKNNGEYFQPSFNHKMDDRDITITYFRPRRAAELIHQNRSVRNTIKNHRLLSLNNNNKPLLNYNNGNNEQMTIKNDDNLPELWQTTIKTPPVNEISTFNRTWCGPPTAITNQNNSDNINEYQRNESSCSDNSTTKIANRPQAATARSNRLKILFQE